MVLGSWLISIAKDEVRPSYMEPWNANRWERIPSRSTCYKWGFIWKSVDSPHPEAKPVMEVLELPTGDTAVTSKKLQMVELMFWSPLQTMHTKEHVDHYCDHLSYLENTTCPTQLKKGMVAICSSLTLISTESMMNKFQSPAQFKGQPALSRPWGLQVCFAFWPPWRSFCRCCWNGWGVGDLVQRPWRFFFQQPSWPWLQQHRGWVA